MDLSKGIVMTYASKIHKLYIQDRANKRSDGIKYII